MPLSSLTCDLANAKDGHSAQFLKSWVLLAGPSKRFSNFSSVCRQFRTSAFCRTPLVLIDLQLPP
jgi:hypothetical protein